MKESMDVSGAAALTICESLLLALSERKILPEEEILNILKDAAAAHDNAPDNDPRADLHKAASAVINGILTGKDSGRRS